MLDRLGPRCLLTPYRFEEQTEGTSGRAESIELQMTCPEGSLANLERALARLVGLSSQKMLSLFCTHLNKESSVRSILLPALFKHL
ncbi:unnamed protein product [Dibothriocephalus latus]|uniref:Uncharacterized protein n=1 Tax=Dibothriocephalus latus TaxID=60516 RepID=A0A3P7LCU6_DIBLA|nr:unnamed protein product [Dibothriocephalus latus]